MERVSERTQLFSERKDKKYFEQIGKRQNNRKRVKNIIERKDKLKSWLRRMPH